MKIKLSLFFILLLYGIQMNAENGESFTARVADDLEMTFVIMNEENLTVAVGDGNNAAIDKTTVGEVILPSSINYNDNNYSIQSINTNAFKDCKSISSISIPEGVSSLGQYAFSGCSDLVSVSIPDNVQNIPNYCFNQCTSLENIVISNGITTIGDYAFYKCTSLSSVELPNTITVINQYAFSKCSKLTSLDLPTSLKTIYGHAFESCGLTSITIPGNVTSIGAYTFNANYNLEKVISKITKPFKFGNQAFSNIGSLCGLHVPEGTKTQYIAQGWNISKFKGGVVEGDDTPTIGFTFTVATEEGINVPYTVSDVDKWEVKIGDGKKAAIANATDISITIPDNVNYEEFEYKVTSLADKAFINCNGIKEVVLPASLASIGSQAFYGCVNLKSVYARMNPIFAFGDNAFSNISNYCGLHVPENTKDAYIESGWTKDIFKGGVVEGDNTPTGGYKFTQTNSEEIEITYVLVDIDEKTVQVGDDIFPAINVENTGTITIPATVTFGEEIYQVSNIGTNAFKNCTGMTDITLPEGLKTISTNAFSECTGLTGIIIPSTVTSIGANAFNGSTNLSKIMSRIAEPFILTGNAFNGIASQSSLHVPEGTKASYVEAGWTNSIFKGGVVEGDDTPTIGFTFTSATEEGIEVTYVVTNVDDLSLKVGDSTNPAVSKETNGSVTIPATIDINGVSYQVVAIAAHSFEGCTKISSVTIPDGVKTVGAYAFYGCSSLSTAILGEGVKTISDYSLSKCKALNSIDLPISLTTIKGHAFESCDLRELIIPENVTSIASYAFNGNYNLGKVISRISAPFKFGNQAFSNNGALCALHVPEGTKDAYLEMGWTKNIFKGGVVEGENSLAGGDTIILKDINGVDILYTIVDIDNKTASVGNGKTAAVNAEDTKTVTIPDCIEIDGQSLTVVSIGAYAFNSCKMLSSISLPQSIISINAYAFNECEMLEEFLIPDAVRAIGSNAFAYSGIKTVSIPEGITTIENATFADCYNLRNVILPSTLTTIKMQAFRHNIRLRSINLPEGLKTLGQHAFYDCGSLSEITLPSTLTSCKDHTFYYCISLEKVIARMENPFIMPTEMFAECSSNLALHIPDGTYDKYVEAGWTPEIFPGGIVYGDDTPTLNDQFTFTTVEGVEVTAILTDIKNNYIQIGIGTTGNPAIDTETEGTITLPDTVEAFGNKYVITTIGGYAFRYATKVTDVRIPKSVTHIGRYGFGNMEALKKIDIPGSVKEMETASFYKCTGLEEITLHEGTETIGNYSFVLAAIKSVEIPKSVTYIGKNSFQACTQLDKVISRIEEPIEFGTETFASISKTCGLHVPEGTKDAYIEKGWTEEIFPGGIVYGDETLHKGQSFELTEADGTVMTYKVTDVNDMLVEITSVTVGEEANGCVEIKPQATDPVAGNTYTVSNIADKAFGSDVTKVLSRIEDPFVLNPAAFSDVAENCALHVPAGTKDTYIEKGWTEEVFPGGVVEGDDTLVKGDTFELTDEDGTVTTYRVTDVNDLKVEIVSVTAGEEAGGIVTIAETATDPVNENDYTVSGIANGAFAEPLKAVKAETPTPFEVTADAFPGIGDKCVLFVPKGTKDNYISNGWTEEVFKGGVHEGNIRGDVNEDLTVDISDIVATINTIAKPDESPWRYADVNGDTKVDISDVVAIINIIAGK